MISIKSLVLKLKDWLRLYKIQQKTINRQNSDVGQFYRYMFQQKNLYTIFFKIKVSALITVEPQSGIILRNQSIWVVV